VGYHLDPSGPGLTNTHLGTCTVVKIPKLGLEKLGANFEHFFFGLLFGPQVPK